MKNLVCLLIVIVYGASFFWVGCDYTKRTTKRIVVERVAYREKPTPVFLPLPKKAKIQGEINFLAAAIDAKKLGLKK